MRLRKFGNDASVFLLDICQTLRIRNAPTDDIVDKDQISDQISCLRIWQWLVNELCDIFLCKESNMTTAERFNITYLMKVARL